MAYTHQEFPKWKYHPERGNKLVNSEDEENELGNDWKNTPAGFPKKESECEDEEIIKDYDIKTDQVKKRPGRPKKVAKNAINEKNV